MKSHVTVPIFVMLRPRSGDFCFKETDLRVLENDLANLRGLADGFVFGFLTEYVSDKSRILHLNVSRGHQTETRKANSSDPYSPLILTGIDPQSESTTYI